jgi:hypothetical protein
MGMAIYSDQTCDACGRCLRYDQRQCDCKGNDHGRGKARERAYRDAAAMVRRWSRGYSTRLQSDMEMLAKQMEAKGREARD